MLQVSVCSVVASAPGSLRGQLVACSVKCQSAPGSLCGQLVAFGVRCCVANELLVASAPGSLRGQLVACSVRYWRCKVWQAHLGPAWAAGGLQ